MFFEDFKELSIKGVYLIDCYSQIDNRGSFVKVYTASSEDLINKLDFTIHESYYSVSKKNVVRGMHFQVPPYEHSKIINVLKGSIIDVVLDLRINSKTYGKSISIHLNSNDKLIFIAKGCAHGFKSLEDDTIVLYHQDSIYSKDHDKGILWNSFDYDWGIINPILSDRDSCLPKLEDFKTPFK